MNRNLGLSAGVIALLALVFHVSPLGGPEGNSDTPGKRSDKTKPVAAGKDEDSQKGNGKSPPEFEGPWIATRAVVGGLPGVRPFPGPPPSRRPAGAAPNYRDVFGTGKLDIETVIATIPDPWHTRLALLMDGELDAIEVAATEAGWVFAAQWLPWTDPIDPDEKDPDKRRKQRRAARDQEDEPGILVFRQAVDRGWKRFNSKLLLVFLVGETPTGGIDRAQFWNARTYGKQLNGGQNRVFVLGPTFSGSFHSLADLLGQDASSKYVIRSGNASSMPDAEALRATDPTIDFRSANMNSDDFRVDFRAALDALDISRGSAAILAEDETRFGTAVSTPIPDSTNPQNSGSAATQPREDPLGDVLTLSFPRDISQLRNAFRDPQTPTGGKALPPEVDFSLKDTEVGEDSIPSFSGPQGPLLQDARLEQAVDIIRRDQIRAVEIIASNSLDVLFLARVLQKKSPDTRIIVPYAHLLFVEAARTAALRNVLALSSYPLFGERHWLLDPGRRVLTFPDSVSEGEYNSMTLLLDQMGASEHPPGSALNDYGWVDQEHPPVWLLTLDRSGFMPIRAWPHSAEQERLESWWQTSHYGGGSGFKTRDFKMRGPSAVWVLFASFLSLIACGAVILVFSLAVLKHRDGRFLPSIVSERDRRRVFYLVHFLLLVAGMQMILCVPWLNYQHERPALMYAGFGEAALLTLLALFLAARWLVVTPGSWRDRVAFSAAMVVSLGAYAVGLRIWAAACRFNEYSAGVFFRLRAVEMRLGSSPALPMLAGLFAITLFCYLHLTRTFLAARHEPMVVRNLETAFHAPLDRARVRLSRQFGSRFGLVSGWQWVWVVAGSLIAFGVAFTFHPYENLEGVDGWRFNVLLVAMEILLVAMLIHGCVQMLSMWQSLKSMLACLEPLPIARAFIARSRNHGKRPLWVQNLNLQSWSTLVRAPLLLHDIWLQQPQGLQVPGSQGTIDLYRDYATKMRALITATPETYQSRVDRLRRKRALDALNVRITKKLFTELLLPQWLSTPLVGKLEGAEEKEEGERALAGQVGIHGNPDKIEDLATAFVAMHFTPFLLYSIRQIQNLVWFLSLGFVSLAVSMNADSPQSPQLISRFLLGLFLVIGVTMWRCLAGIERDPILSRIEGTKAEQLSAEFYFKLLAYGALPVLGLLASEFPSIANFLFSWIEPTLAALR